MDVSEHPACLCSYSLFTQHGGSLEPLSRFGGLGDGGECLGLQEAGSSNLPLQCKLQGRLKRRFPVSTNRVTMTVILDKSASAKYEMKTELPSSFYTFHPGSQKCFISLRLTASCVVLFHFIEG